MKRLYLNDNLLHDLYDIALLRKNKDNLYKLATKEKINDMTMLIDIEKYNKIETLSKEIEIKLNAVLLKFMKDNNI